VDIDTVALTAALDAERTAQELTWTELGEVIGTHAATFSRLKLGRVPGEATLEKILDWLGEPLEHFTTDCGCENCEDCEEHSTTQDDEATDAEIIEFTDLTPKTTPVSASMLAALPSEHSLAALGIEFTEELPHVTLSFLGDGGEMPDGAPAALDAIPIDGPVEVTIAGYGALGSAEPPATVLFLNGSQLGELRSAMQVEGQPEQHEPFIAHITIGYGVPMDGLNELVGSTIVLDRVALVGAENTILEERQLVGDDSDAAAASATTFHEGHEPAELEELAKDEDDEKFSRAAAIVGRGKLSESNDPDTMLAVARVAELLAEGAVGVSIRHDMDPASMPDPALVAELEAEGRWDELDELFDDIKIRPRHVAIVDTPAFADAKLSITEGTMEVEGPVAFEGTWTGDVRILPYGQLVWGGDLLPIPIIWDREDGDHSGMTIGFISELERIDGVTSALRPEALDDTDVEAITSATSLGRLPAHFFAKCNTSKPHPVKVSEPDPTTGLRRYYGLVAPRGVCHRSDMGRCFTFPGDVDQEMAGFHTGSEVTLDDGTRMRLGAVTMGGLHIDTALGRRVEWREINRHREDTNQIVAAVRAWEDRHGCWVSGVLMPDMDRPEVLLRLAAAGPSVELWPRGTGRTLVGVHMVPTPAWPVAAAAGSAVTLTSGQVEVEGVEPPPSIPTTSTSGNSARHNMTVNVTADTSELERQLAEAFAKGDPRIDLLLSKVSTMEEALGTLLAAHLSEAFEIDLDAEES
jgi:transcriptional regulator with XRE-family HTH domain